MTGPLAPLALAQLQAWEVVGRGWPVRFIPRETGLHLCCSACGQTVFTVTDAQGVAYQCSLGSVLAVMVAHLRNVHRDIEREVYGGKDPETANEPRATGDSSRGDPDLD